jgi:hypothetical protein
VGSMVPFAFRLLLAELPQYLAKHQEALNRLHALLATVRKVSYVLIVMLMAVTVARRKFRRYHCPLWQSCDHPTR